MPKSTTPPSLPFKFTGGFDLTTKDIGIILSCQGLLQMCAQLIVFPMVTKRLGPLWTFRVAVLGYPVLYLLVPYLPLVPNQYRVIGIGFILLWKVTNQAFSYPSNNLMLVDAAPSPRVLGTLNGISSAAASLARAFGPTLAGIAQAAGLSHGYLGVPWWGCSVVAIGGAVLSFYQTHVPRKEMPAPVSEVRPDEESGLAGPILAAFLESDSTDGEEDANLSSKSSLRT
jgi:hypothetical protein